MPPSLPDRLRSLASQCRKQMPQGLPRTLDDMAAEVEELQRENDYLQKRRDELTATLQSLAVHVKGDGK